MRRVAGLAALAIALMAVNVRSANADVAGWDFEPPTFTAGQPLDGQGGWSMALSSLDVEVVSTTPYGSPPALGSQSLRASNAVGSGTIIDQPHAPSLADPAGETEAVAGAGSSGSRQPHFDLRFAFRSTEATQQDGLQVQVAASDHLGGRMSLLLLEDGPTGLEVSLSDTPSPTCSSGAPGCIAFRETLVAGGLTRETLHRVRLTIDFVEGPDNDVVRVYVDRSLRFTGTSWENYYRSDPEQANNSNTIPLIDTLALRLRDSVPSTEGNGLLLDNFRLQSSPTPSPTPRGGVPQPSPIPGEPGAATPMRILAASMNRRTGIIRARLACPDEAGQCAASVTVRGDGNVRARRDFVRSAGATVTLHLKPSRKAIARLRRANQVTITVFSRNTDGIGSRIRQRLPRN